MNQMLRHAKSLRKDSHGNVAIMAVMSLVPIIGAVGATTNYSIASSIRQDLQDSVDTAALAGAIAYIKYGEARLTSDGEETFGANVAGSDAVEMNKITVRKLETDHVQATASAKAELPFGSLFGLTKTDISATAKATVAQSYGAEVAIAIDTTNSMALGSSWNDTMGTIENILTDMKQFTGDDNFYVTLIPFQDWLNLGRSRESWTVSGSANEWTGCVEPRAETIGGFDWMLDDDSPTSEKFGQTTKNQKMSGNKIHCPQSEIAGPTNDIESVIRVAKNLKKGGTGRYDLGLAWAWRAMSPKWTGLWNVGDYPSAYFDETKIDEPDFNMRKKYIIYMTDGRSNAFKHEAMREEDWGWNNGSKKAFENIVRLCDTIKSNGVEIYMLHIPGNSNSDTYFQDCASTADHYRVINDVTDMTFAFDGIKSSIYAQVVLAE